MIRRLRLLFLVVVPVALVGCDRGGPDNPEEDGAAASPRISVVCQAALPSQLNSFVSHDRAAADLLPLIFTPLVVYDSAGDLRGYLASDWSWSSERTEVRIALKDVSWHDGEPLTADDVAWTIRTAADHEYGYHPALAFDGIDGVETIGADTVVIRYEQPAALDLEPFVHLPILPRHLLGGLEPERFRRAEYHRQPVGSGPFRVAQRDASGALRLDRVRDFPEAIASPRVERLVLREIPEPSTQLIALRTGEVDACVTGISVAPEMTTATDLKAVSIEPLPVQSLPLDTRRPPFDDPRVRRALSAALDRELIARAIMPQARPATSYLPPSSPWYDADFRQPDANEGLADSLLVEAGWRRGEGGMRSSDGEPLRVQLVAPQSFRDQLVVVQEQARRVGMDLQLRFMAPSSYSDLILDADRRPRAMAMGFSPTRVLHPDLRLQFHSESRSNLASYGSPIADSLIKLLERPLQTSERRRIHSELQRLIAREVPNVYLVYTPRLLVMPAGAPLPNPDLNGPLAIFLR